MVAFEGSGQCREAQLYYHDFLQDRDAVPKSVAGHIDGCAHCRAHVQRLGQVLGEAAKSRNPYRLSHSHELIAELQSHFEHVGEQVTCSQVRRFLPGLLADRIRIPTPVTVHVDQCDRCTEDVERLRSLGLTQEQLAGLEELYAEPIQVDLSLCRQVRLMLAETDDLALEEVPAHLADHICSCPQCRDRIYEARQALLDHCREHPVADPIISCGRVMAGDIFDFVVLRGSDAFDQALAADWHQLVADHVFSCSRCLEKVQNMHRVIYGIADRADSGVATVYAATGTVVPPSRKARNSYAAYPIDVRVVGGRLKAADRQSRRAGALAASLRRRIDGHKLRFYASAVAMGTVVILLAGLFTVSGHSASALNVGQVNRVFSKVTSVRIISIPKDSPTPESETWVSSSLPILAQEIPGQQTRISHASKRLTITVAPGQSRVHKTNMTAKDYTDTMTSIRRYLESGITGFSANTELRRQGESVDEIDPVLDVYEISSQGAAQGKGSGEQRMLVYLDPAKNLLKKTELYRRLTPDQRWELEITKRFEYPTDAEVLRHFDGIISRN